MKKSWRIVIPVACSFILLVIPSWKVYSENKQNQTTSSLDLFERRLLQPDKDFDFFYQRMMSDMETGNDTTCRLEAEEDMQIYMNVTSSTLNLNWPNGLPKDVTDQLFNTRTSFLQAYSNNVDGFHDLVLYFDNNKDPSYLEKAQKHFVDYKIAIQVAKKKLIQAEKTFERHY